MILKVKRISFIVILFMCYGINVFSQNAKLFGEWNNIESFDINNSEDYLVIEKKINGLSKLFELNKVVFGWTEPKEITAINSYSGGTANIGGPFLQSDGKRLYYHANFNNDRYNLFYSDRTPNGWSAPVEMDEKVNNDQNQFYPSITPGNKRLIYATGYPQTYEFKKGKNSPQCLKIASQYMQPDGTWGTPYFLHQVINNGCQQSPVLASDGKTIFYSAIDENNYKDGFQLKYTYENMPGFWYIPKTIEVNEELEGDKLNIRVVNSNIYFIRSYIEKKQSYKQIYVMPLNKKFHQKKVVSTKGKIVTKASLEPVQASLTVFDPISLEVIGRYISDEHTGEFELTLLDGMNYTVDIRKYGFSFASFNVDLRDKKKKLMPKQIELFDTIELTLSVYDNEIYSPINVEAIATMKQNEQNSFKATKIDKGIYSFKLPLGSNYKLEAYTDWFDPNEFLFKLEGDIVFSQFNRNLPLTPQKNIFTIVTSDSETGAVFTADGYLVNLTSDEPPIFFSANDVDENGNINVNLRKGDKYELNLNKNGYFFHTQLIDLQEEDIEIDFNLAIDSLATPIKTTEKGFELTVKMDSLREEKAITLNNITFEKNSFSLSSDSFIELNKIAKLLIDNPNITIEISAHTDDIGSAYYNNILSDKRAQSVVGYLLENQIPSERMVAKGYGFSQPKVPNNSEENRATNRRVEFKVISKKMVSNE